MSPPTNAKFSIPAEVQDRLRYVEPLDQRSDEEILQSLTEFKPVTSEKNLWGFWDKGVQNMPSWQQRNVVNWIRLNGNDWTVRIIDHVPGSPNHASNYVTTELQPVALKERNMTGGALGHAPQHKADLYRSAALYLHGGIWMDVGFLLLRNLDDLCWNRIMDPTDPAEVGVIHTVGTACFNGFVATRKGNILVKLWHELFLHVWEGRTSLDGISRGPLLQPILASFVHRTGDQKVEDRMPMQWKTLDPTLMADYGAQIFCLQRLVMVIDPSINWNGPDYWMNHVLLLDGLRQATVLDMQPEVNGIGQNALNILHTPLDTPTDSPEFQLAYRIVWDVLANASLQAGWHAKNLAKYDSLATIFDRTPGADIKPGTFAELLRYGAVHFRKTQPQEHYKINPKPDVVIERGLYEGGSFTRFYEPRNGSTEIPPSDPNAPLTFFGMPVPEETFENGSANENGNTPVPITVSQGV